LDVGTLPSGLFTVETIEPAQLGSEISFLQWRSAEKFRPTKKFSYRAKQFAASSKAFQAPKPFE